MKSVWKGSISFGLVNIPVKLYSATQPRTVSFRYLCKKCHSPLKYQRYCPKCKKDIPWENVVYGFDTGEGYKIFTQQEIEKLKPEKSDIAEVLNFVDTSEIDLIYFNKSYYIIPDKKKEKSFFLFMEALRSAAKAAVVKIILRTKEYLAVIRPYKNVLLMTTLLYESEIRKLKDFEELKEKPKVSSDELKLANQLIKKYSKKEFDISEHEDKFAEKVKEIVTGKKSKKEVKEKSKPKPEKLKKALELSIESQKKNE